MNVPGFFKLGFYAEAIRAIVGERNLVALEGVDDSQQDITSTSTIMELFPTSTDRTYEYEAFGELSALTLGISFWDLEVLDTNGDVLKKVRVQVSVGLGEGFVVPWYIRGRTTPTSVGSDGYRLRVTEGGGAGTLKVMAARLYSI